MPRPHQAVIDRATIARFALAIVVSLAGAAPALAQRLPFERTFDVTGTAALDVLTDRGKIEIEPGNPGRIVVLGTVTIRVGLTVPADALEIARKVAANPPVEQNGSVVRLRIPSTDTERRAVTVSYVVRVPPATNVTSRTESGETSIHGVNGGVDVRTQSATIGLGDLGGAVTVLTGSGDVTVVHTGGPLSVTTESSAITATDVAGNLRIRTGSGAVNAGMLGAGDVDVTTRSSAIRLRRVDGGLAVSTQSGRVTVDGSPRTGWDISTSSSAIDLSVAHGSTFTLDATSRSSDVKIVGGSLQNVTKGRANGAVGGSGGPVVRASTASGSIRVSIE
jgi:hypothetical protein